MGTFLDADDLAGWVQATPDMVAQAISDVEAKARRVAPGIFSPTWTGNDGGRDLVVSILRMAAVWLVSSKGGRVTQHTTGPFSETFRDSASGLTDEDIADLRSLCGDAQQVSGLPRWDFPPVSDYSQLFARPPRRTP